MGRAVLLSQSVLCPVIRALLTISVRQIRQFSKLTVQYELVYRVRERLMLDCPAVELNLRCKKACVYQSGWVGGMGLSVWMTVLILIEQWWQSVLINPLSLLQTLAGHTRAHIYMEANICTHIFFSWGKDWTHFLAKWFSYVLPNNVFLIQNYCVPFWEVNILKVSFVPSQVSVNRD